jgi:hypothetical protein
MRHCHPRHGYAQRIPSLTIQGTQNLLEVAKESQYVRVFIYTSSSTLYNGIEQSNLTEGYPLAHVVPSAPSYARANGFVEPMELDANVLIYFASVMKKPHYEGISQPILYASLLFTEHSISRRLYSGMPESSPERRVECTTRQRQKALRLCSAGKWWSCLILYQQNHF